MTVAAVAISGGVDSLVSAFLLRSAGHEVIGLHFLTGFENTPSAEAAEHPVHRIGVQLGIPIHVVTVPRAWPGVDTSEDLAAVRRTAERGAPWSNR